MAKKRKPLTASQKRRKLKCEHYKDLQKKQEEKAKERAAANMAKRPCRFYLAGNCNKVRFYIFTISLYFKSSPWWPVWALRAVLIVWARSITGHKIPINQALVSACLCISFYSFLKWIFVFLCAIFGCSLFCFVGSSQLVVRRLDVMHQSSDWLGRSSLNWYIMCRTGH